MKKILIKKISNVLVLLGVVFSFCVIAQDLKIKDPSLLVDSTSLSDGADKVKDEPAVIKESAVSLEKKETVKTKTNFKYRVTKSTLYNQLAYDFAKEGYKTIWSLNFDPSFIPEKYDSVEDEMVWAVNRLNQVWKGNFQDGNKVLALICPLNKEIHFTFSAYASSIVDKNKVSCNLITPIDDMSNYPSYESSTGANSGYNTPSYDNYGGETFFQSDDVRSGPMIIGR